MSYTDAEFAEIKAYLTAINAEDTALYRDQQCVPTREDCEENIQKIQDGFPESEIEKAITRSRKDSSHKDC